MLGLLSCALKRVIIELCQEKSSNHEKHGWNFYAKVVFLQPLLLRTSAISRRLYLGRRLDSHQDEFALLATYRGGRLISFQDK